MMNIIIFKNMRRAAMVALLSIFTLSLSAQQGVNITGTVSDDKGVTLPGATVQVKGTNSGTVTDANGKFSITVPDDNAVLVFSFVGYGTQEITVGSQRDITVALSEGEQLEGVDIVVDLGYGVRARQSDLSGSAGVLKNVNALKARPVTSVNGMLQGQIPGVTVRNVSGSPVDNPEIKVRGIGSKSGEGVLIVVDGVPDGNYILDDVESVVVLKDAASAAIYGAQTGAAGVILITTKKAKAGKTSISYDGNFSINTATNLPHGLTAPELIELRKQGLGDAWATSPWNPAINPYIGTQRTDWTDETFRTSLTQRHTLTLSGGTETFSNRLSLNYVDNQGTIVNTWNKNLQVRYNTSFQLAKYVKISEDAFLTTGNNNNFGGTSGYDGTMMRMIATAPYAEAYYADGSLGGTWMDPRDPATAEYTKKYGYNEPFMTGDNQTPLMGLMNNNKFNRPLNFRSTTMLEIKDIIKGLRFNSRFTFYTARGFSKTFNKSIWQPGRGSNTKSTMSYWNSWDQNWQFENTLNYDRTFGNHTVGAMVASTTSQSNHRGNGSSVDNLIYDDEIAQYYKYLSGSGKVNNPTDEWTQDRNVAFLGRIAYSFADRYFLTASMRRDYAARLPENKKYGDFPAVTAAWKLTSEPFMPKNDVMNLLKIRASWGRIGNIGSLAISGTPKDINNPGYLGLPMINYTLDASYAGFAGKDNPYVGSAGPGTAFNPFLTWETSEQTNIGFDSEWLNHRLSFSAEYFHKKTIDLIRAQDFNWPSYIGLTAPQINDGEVTNTGFEFSLGWNDVIGKDFSYFVSANLATLKNEITNIGGNVDANGKKAPWTFNGGYRVGGDPLRSYEGDPMYAINAIKADGLFQSDEEAKAYVNKDGNMIQPDALGGDVKLIDYSGPDGVPDGKIDAQDRQYLGKYFPDLTYAMTAGFTWKSLSFSFMLQGVSGVSIWNPIKGMWLDEEQGSFNRWNKILEAWPNGGEVPRINGNEAQNFGDLSGYYFEDGDYMRVKNVTLAYTFDNLIRKNPFLNERRSSLTVSFSVDNLLTFTKYMGIDPEVGNNGLDQGTYPVPRIFSFGIRINY